MLLEPAGCSPSAPSCSRPRASLPASTRPRPGAGGVLAVAAVGALAGWVFVRSGGTGVAPFDPALLGAARAARVDAFRAVVLAVAGLAALASTLAVALLRDREPA